jgi:uncharacterized protein involved in exopolysaccharide biosynthesis
MPNASSNNGSETVTKPSYRQTFREHRRLLSLPVVIAVVIAAWFALGSPKSYQSSASLWVDNPASLGSSLGNANPALLPPSQQEQSVFHELLSTQSFVLKVAHESGLYGYLATHGSGGFSPTSLLSGGGGPVKAKVLNSFGAKQVASSTPGPQVLAISYRGPTPGLTTSTLGALVNELQKQSDLLSHERNQTVLAYDRAQVAAASKTLSAARAEVQAYTSQHPVTTGSDPNLTALQTAAGAASSQLTAATQKLNQAQSAANDSNSSGATLSAIDKPTNALPVSGKKKELLIILGGLFAGLLISFLGAVALTPGKRDVWDAEAASAGPPLPAVEAPLNRNGNGHSGAPRPAGKPASNRSRRAGPSKARPRQLVDESAPEAS